MYNYMSRDVTASVGYDLILRQVNSAFANDLLSMKYDYLLGVLLLWSFEFACMHPWHVILFFLFLYIYIYIFYFHTPMGLELTASLAGWFNLYGATNM